MRWFAAAISLKVSAIFSRTPACSPVMRTEKSPVRIACSAANNSYSKGVLPFPGDTGCSAN